MKFRNETCSTRNIDCNKFYNKFHLLVKTLKRIVKKKTIQSHSGIKFDHTRTIYLVLVRLNVCYIFIFILYIVFDLFTFTFLHI